MISILLFMLFACLVFIVGGHGEEQKRFKAEFDGRRKRKGLVWRRRYMKVGQPLAFCGGAFDC